MSKAFRIWAVVPAAGAGSRMRTARPKQYLPLLGRPILLHTLERLATHPLIEGVWVGIASDDELWRTLEPHLSRLPKVLGAFTGGPQRADTVLRGLQALAAHASSADRVLVHDAVRPCLRHADIDKLIAEVDDYPDGGLLGLPVADTVKRTDASGVTIETVSRTNLWRALTPQLFPLRRLRTALEQAAADDTAITDEAVAVERLGGRPRVIAGHPDNIKITLAEDLALAELLIKRQEKERA